MNDLVNIKNVYLIGIGGIGMSALARYFKAIGKNVAGYDRVSTVLTSELEAEGIDIHYVDNSEMIASCFTLKNDTLVIYTPAIPENSVEMNFFREKGFELKKRAEVLGIITKTKKGIAIAGTHGKTTVSTMVAHILQHSGFGCSAFLGGISLNYKTNLLLDTNSDYVVIEADEYDRSFLHLEPHTALITSADPDHLDIYGDFETMKAAFSEFTGKTKKNGNLLIKQGVEIKPQKPHFYHLYNYSFDAKYAGFRAENVRIEKLNYIFDFVAPIDNKIKDCSLGIKGIINVENAVAAMSVASLLGVPNDKIRNAIGTFRGIKRRFEVHIEQPDNVYIDDYAHHPEELRATIISVRKLFPHRRITGVFQPHLYTRTHDFAPQFAEYLNFLDDIILLDIYPAREEPIEGVSSRLIFDQISNPEKTLCTRDDVIDILREKKTDVVLTLGAGNIDELVKPIKELLLHKTK